MTPEAFEELMEQHYGTSNPGLVKAVQALISGVGQHESIEEVNAWIEQEAMRLAQQAWPAPRAAGGRRGRRSRSKRISRKRA